MLSSRRLRAVSTFLCGLVLAAAPLAAAPLTTVSAHYGESVGHAELSPDGRHVVALTRGPTGQSVMLIKTDDLSHRIIDTQRMASFGHARYLKRPRRVTWLSDTLLGVSYGFEAEALDLDGKRVVDLGVEIIGKLAPSDPTSPLVLVYDDEDREKVAVYNLQTRKSQRLSYPMSGTLRRWIFDEHGELRAVTLADSSYSSEKTLVSHWYRSPLTQQWEKLLEGKADDLPWRPLAVEAGRNRLVVASREGRETYGVFSYDPVKRQLGELLAGHPTEDIQVDDDRLQATHFQSVTTFGMKPTRYWFDERWAALQAGVDAALPKRINWLSGDPKGMVLVYSYADVDPGRWLLLDARTMSMRVVLERNGHIKPAEMRPMAVIRYAAADGLTIPAYLTRPADSGHPAPMVVMIHGGPEARDEWSWDAGVQLLAARGYAVFQPQFRGSTGFGKSFEKAGEGQWGLAMQDDITAGVEHLIATGVADRDRICIYGTSYGGYAALWGLIKTPKLYRCGVSLAGVTDIGERLTDWSDTNANKFARESLRRDIEKQGRSSLDEVSPVRHAQKIEAPVLLAHGDSDIRVPIGHSKRMMKALDKHKKPYEWLPIPDEGHGMYYVKSQLLFDEALIKFIDKHIGTPRPKAAAP